MVDMGISQKQVSVERVPLNSEINFSISTFWDGGFDVKLGDEMSGFSASANFRTLRECIYWLADEAIKKYPDSKFAEAFIGGVVC